MGGLQGARLTGALIDRLAGQHKPQTVDGKAQRINAVEQGRKSKDLARQTDTSQSSGWID